MNTERTIGQRPVGTARGNERWVTIRTDDRDVIVTAWRGWLVSDTIVLSGSSAVGMAEDIADDLLAVV